MAQAVVDFVNYRLDETVADFTRDFDRILHGDRRNPRWTRYFGSSTPSVIRRMGLKNEVERIASWSESLQSEAEPELKSYGTRFAEIMADGRKALETRARAATARADHRVREIVSFIDDVNALRLGLYGELLSRTGRDRRHDRTWPGEFFQTAIRTPLHREQSGSDTIGTEQTETK